MNFASLIDAELETNAQLDGSQRTEDTDGRCWTKDAAGAKIMPSGSTGSSVALFLSDRIVHERIFAASSMSVTRIVRTITRTPHRLRELTHAIQYGEDAEFRLFGSARVVCGAPDQREPVARARVTVDLSRGESLKRALDRPYFIERHAFVVVAE